MLSMHPKFSFRKCDGGYNAILTNDFSDIGIAQGATYKLERSNETTTNGNWWGYQGHL